MDYIELSFKIPEQFADTAEILIAALSENGYNSFFEKDKTLCAYIPEPDFKEAVLKTIQGQYNIPAGPFTYSFKTIPDQNWNELWESNFEPVCIDNYCIIRAPFHLPATGYKHSITIEPKMSFGTGHHETTRLMMKTISKLDFRMKKVLDMGCGTGILGILASMEGASCVTAVDNDPWAYENAQENVTKNNRANISVLPGDSDIIKGETYDIILANINRNIILSDMQKYSESLVSGGCLLTSGFYSGDSGIIQKEAEKNGLHQFLQMEENKWVVVAFNKK